MNIKLEKTGKFTLHSSWTIWVNLITTRWRKNSRFEIVLLVLHHYKVLALVKFWQ